MHIKKIVYNHLSMIEILEPEQTCIYANAIKDRITEIYTAQDTVDVDKWKIFNKKLVKHAFQSVNVKVQNSNTENGIWQTQIYVYLNREKQFCISFTLYKGKDYKC